MFNCTRIRPRPSVCFHYHVLPGAPRELIPILSTTGEHGDSAFPSDADLTLSSSDEVRTAGMFTRLADLVGCQLTVRRVRPVVVGQEQSSDDSTSARNGARLGVDLDNQNPKA